MILSKRQLKTAVICGDIHIPYHDRQSLAVVYSIIRALAPNKLILIGDIMDCYSVSSFSKDPMRIDSLQSEITLAQGVLKEFQAAAPKASRYILEGNHEQRLQRTINNLAGTAAELPRLVSFQEAVNWPNMLKLHSTGWTWVSMDQQPNLGIIPNLAIKHGDIVRKYSGYTANGEYQKYHLSGVSGHTHRLAHFQTTTLSQTHFWLETGCLCVSNDMGYIRYPDWQQGFAVITYTDDGTVLSPELVNIQNGQAIFRGKRYGKK